MDVPCMVQVHVHAYSMCSTGEFHAWYYVHAYMHIDTILGDENQLVPYHNFQGRAWFRLSLVQKKLSSFMYTILDQQEILKTFYLPGGFLYSDSLTELAGTLKCLDAIDFK